MNGIPEVTAGSLARMIRIPRILKNSLTMPVALET